MAVFRNPLLPEVMGAGSLATVELVISSALSAQLLSWHRRSIPIDWYRPTAS